MAHGSGLKVRVTAPRSKHYQGPFGRLCPDLPPWSPPGVPEHHLDRFFLDIANSQMVELPGKTPGEIAADPNLIAQLESNFGSKIPAGYTYFGQFVDHDITFDPTSSLMRRNDPNGLANFRTPRLDLDNVYGRGPDDQPYLYDQEDKNPQTGKAEKLLIGKVAGTRLRDLPRNSQGRALIGDMRNDENSIVSQVQLAFLLAHNNLVDRARSEGLENPFEAARQTLRWLYQHIVWNDFAKRIVNDEVHAAALRRKETSDGRTRWTLGLGDVYSWKRNPFMPVEFSVAAYRFGHSMVRNAYQTNHPHRGFGKFVPLFDNTGAGAPDDLRGFRPMVSENVVQWDWFLEMTTSQGPFPQRARKIDTKLSNALAFLHEGPANSPMNVLAFRNLKRGWTFELPAGTEMARKLCLKPAGLRKGQPDALWFYILREAESLPGANGGEMLGRLGSIIVSATFAGLLLGDPCSYLNLDPCWTPGEDPLLRDGVDNVDDPDWKLASIIRLSGLPVEAADVTQQS